MNGAQGAYANYAAGFHLNDGTFVAVKVDNNSPTYKRAIIKVDINGNKKPNKVGRDIFEFAYNLVTSNKLAGGRLVPTGNELSRSDLISGSDEYLCSKNKFGTKCAALIMKDGWQIKDDYPW